MMWCVGDGGGTSGDPGVKGRNMLDSSGTRDRPPLPSTKSGEGLGWKGFGGWVRVPTSGFLTPSSSGVSGYEREVSRIVLSVVVLASDQVRRTQDSSRADWVEGHRRQTGPRPPTVALESIRYRGGQESLGGRRRSVPPLTSKGPERVVPPLTSFPGRARKEETRGPRRTTRERQVCRRE